MIYYGIDVPLTPNGIKLKDNIYDFKKGFTMVITNKD